MAVFLNTNFTKMPYSFTNQFIMKRSAPLYISLLLVFITCGGFAAHAQKVDSLFFNLYTDSLKKGVYNYINVDGKLSDGRWLPLTTKEVSFTASGGRFDGNCLVIDTGFKAEMITVKAVLKNNPAVWKETTIYIKKVEVVERLRTVDEILNSPGSKRSRRRG